MHSSLKYHYTDGGHLRSSDISSYVCVIVCVCTLKSLSLFLSNYLIVNSFFFFFTRSIGKKHESEWPIFNQQSNG